MTGGACMVPGIGYTPECSRLENGGIAPVYQSPLDGAVGSDTLASCTFHCDLRRAWRELDLRQCAFSCWC